MRICSGRIVRFSSDLVVETKSHKIIHPDKRQSPSDGRGAFALPLPIVTESNGSETKSHKIIHPDKRQSPSDGRGARAARQ